MQKNKVDLEEENFSGLVILERRLIVACVCVCVCVCACVCVCVCVCLCVFVCVCGIFV